MHDTRTLEALPSEESPPSGRMPWLTHRNVAFFVIGWLIVFALGSIFVANPFAGETSAAATPDYWRVMYLHGLLIGLAGLVALLACNVFSLRSRHVRLWIGGGVVFATVAAGIGGIFDRRIPGAEVAMWMQIAGFFALDEILLALLIGMWRERPPRRFGLTHSLPFWVAWLAAGSMFLAALMGHLAGWIMEFGARPAIIGEYARHLGIGVSDWAATLAGSHSHEMAVAVMALVVVLAAVQFGFAALEGAARRIATVALALIGTGIVVMTAIYVVGGFSTWEPPTVFQSAGGTNGIAGDDVVTGVLVMGGGVALLLAFLAAGAGKIASMLGRPARLGAAWSWVLSFAMVVIAGFAIELHETYFGAGDPAKGAEKDAVFTWLHQDVGLFLFPALVLVMLIVERYLAPRYQGTIGWLVIAGTTIAFVGGLVFVFIDPALHGAGYMVSAVGLTLIGTALVATMWWGAFAPRRTSRHAKAVREPVTR